MEGVCTGFVTRLTRRMPLVEQELLTLPENLRYSIQLWYYLSMWLQEGREACLIDLWLWRRKNRLKTAKWQSKATNRIRTDNSMAEIKRTNRRLMVNKKLHIETPRENSDGPSRQAVSAPLMTDDTKRRAILETMIFKTLHRKMKIDQKRTIHQEMNSRHCLSLI